AGELLVEEADLIEDVSLHHEGRAGRDMAAVKDFPAEIGRAQVEANLPAAPALVEDIAGRASAGFRARVLKGGELTRQFFRARPDLVGIKKRNPAAAGGPDAGIARRRRASVRAVPDEPQALR